MIDIVQKPLPRWVIFLYGPLFKVIGFFYRIYTANRRRYQDLKANRKLSSIINFVAILILLLWLLLWIFASEENRNRLADDVKQTIGGFASDPGQ